MKVSELQKELRIGNYIIGKYVDELDERKECWEQYQIKDAEDLMGVKDGWDERIPLTEEWLLKFGFENKTLEYWGIKVFEKNGFVLDDKFAMMDIDIRVEFKTVHHLQNSFFALTGEELTVNN